MPACPPAFSFFCFFVGFFKFWGCMFVSLTRDVHGKPSRNEAVDVSLYTQSVGLLQLPPCRTAVVDHSPTAACSKRRCPGRFGERSCQAGIEGVALASIASNSRYPFSCTLLIPIAAHPNRSISSSCISSLLPVPRNHDVTSRLRAASVYLRPVTRTKRYTPFINFSLLYYQ